MKNRITTTFSKIEKLPNFLQKKAKNFALHYTVPFLGTAGISFEETTFNQWTVTLKNRKKVRNHLKQVHAAGMLLLAESAAVFLTSHNLTDDKLPLVKRIEADFVKRSQGDLKAVATLSQEQIEMIRTTEKGETIINVMVTDADNNQPVLVKVTSAWITKSKKN